MPRRAQYVPSPELDSVRGNTSAMLPNFLGYEHSTTPVPNPRPPPAPPPNNADNPGMNSWPSHTLGKKQVQSCINPSRPVVAGAWSCQAVIPDASTEPGELGQATMKQRELRHLMKISDMITKIFMVEIFQRGTGGSEGQEWPDCDDALFIYSSSR